MRIVVAWSVTALTVLVFGLATVLGFQYATLERITPGVSVLNVAVGGLTVSEAQARLAPRAAAILDQPLDISIGDRSWATSPRGLGVRLEPAELAQRAYAIGRSGSVTSRVRAHVDALQGGVDIPVVEQADSNQIDALVARIAADVHKPVRNAKLVLHDNGTLEFATSEPGLELDQPASRQEIASALTTGAPRANLLTRTIAPTSTTDQFQAAHDQLQRILTPPQPIELTAGDLSRRLDQSNLRTIVSLDQPTARDVRAAVRINREPIETIVAEMAREIDRAPVDARFTWDGSRLTPIREGRDGRQLDASPAVDLIADQILSGARKVDLPIATVRPAVPSDDGGASLGIRELIDQSTTTFAGSVPEKAHNIRLAAQRLNGVVVPPGGTFSFNAEVGPTTLESGYQWGFGLTTGSAGARTVPSVAGGICQVATTLFQSVFWAGYQLEERFWHLYWIPNYTSRGVVGLDATVDSDSNLDFKWINPTNDFVLIQASTSADSVTFRLYGRKPAWKVTVDAPVISDRVAPDQTPDVQPEPLLAWGRVVAVETAREGFQVVLSRHVVPENGGAARDLLLKSIYKPGRNVTLVGTARAPDAASITAAVDRVRGSLQPQPAAGAPSPGSSSASGPAGSASITTPNGPRTMAQIRDELRRAGWGGGSDEDAVATYNRLAANRGN